MLNYIADLELKQPATLPCSSENLIPSLTTHHSENGTGIENPLQTIGIDCAEENNANQIVQPTYLQNMTYHDVTFEEDPTQLKLRVRILEIQVTVQKDTIDRINQEKSKLSSDFEDLKAEVQLGSNINNSLRREEETETHCKCNSEGRSRLTEYQATISNLTVQIQRLMHLNTNIEYGNQILRAELQKIAQYNQGLGQENTLLKQSLASYSQQRMQLYQSLEASKEVQRRNALLQQNYNRLQQQLNTHLSKQDQLTNRKNSMKSVEREFIRSKLGKRDLSPFSSCPDTIHKPHPQITSRGVKENLSIPKPISANVMTKAGIEGRASKIAGPEHSKWVKLQDRINALKNQNSQLRKSIFTK